MYELIILSFLMWWPMHGYLFVKIINDMIGPLAKVSNAGIYPVLAKLEREGLIAVVTPMATAPDAPRGRAERRQRTYQITEAGRRRFYQLMMDTTSHPGDYPDFFWHKSMFLDLLAPAERTYLLDHYLTYCQAHLFHLTGELESVAEDAARDHAITPAQVEATRRVLRHRLSRWELELEHARALRARVAPAPAKGEAAAPSEGEPAPRAE